MKVASAARQLRNGLRTAIIVLCLLTMVGWNLQGSELRTLITEVTKPFVQTTGLRQKWDVFAPNPRAHSLNFQARIHFRDGTSRIWSIPQRGDLFGAYSDYRWLKWMEKTSGSATPVAERSADWILRAVDGEQEATCIVLIQETLSNADPELPPVDYSWESRVYYERALHGHDCPAEGS